VDLHDGRGTQERFRTYAADLASVLGHADRVRPFEDYCVGLLSAEGRKSVEPLDGIGANRHVTAQANQLLGEMRPVSRSARSLDLLSYIPI
jgi:SRSO17 transposase